MIKSRQIKLLDICIRIKKWKKLIYYNKVIACVCFSLVETLKESSLWVGSYFFLISFSFEVKSDYLNYKTNIILAT